MTDLSAVADAPERAMPDHITLNEKDFGVLIDLRQRCEEAKVRYNAAAEDAKSKKKSYEGAREVFETNFDRIVRRAKGEDLPLFSQSELLDKAKNDPVVAKLVDGLLQLGHDVNAIIVSGYTQDERHLVEQYLEAEANRKALIESEATDVPDVEVPAFLKPQPLTPIEIADLLQRLANRDYEFEADELAAWTKAQTAEAMDWLTRCEAIEKDKGDAVTADDLPAAPEFFETDDDEA